MGYTQLKITLIVDDIFNLYPIDKRSKHLMARPLPPKRIYVSEQDYITYMDEQRELYGNVWRYPFHIRQHIRAMIIKKEDDDNEPKQLDLPV